MTKAPCRDLWEYESRLIAEGYKVICGVDEAGRGPLAGPVYAAAVVLPYRAEIAGLDDSKKVPESRREGIYEEIFEKAQAVGIGSADNIEIDEHNILGATYLAMNRAIEALGARIDLAIIDGNRSEGITCANMCIVGGDGKSASIAAASIIAKVSRDRYMKELAKTYPQYGFDKHKGYGTKQHYELLGKYGPCAAHRETFLRKWRAGA
ncbi:MAG: ribonuclease HII [Oscillospiraceae bacterium]|nr:ribonuclease HII [Oscillospiraceae bacterium]